MTDLPNTTEERTEHVTLVMHFGTLQIHIAHVVRNGDESPWWIELTGAESIRLPNGQWPRRELTPADGWYTRDDSPEGRQKLERQVRRSALTWAAPIFAKFAAEAAEAEAALRKLYNEIKDGG